MTVIRNWPLHQLDIKNAFLHGDLDEEIYMEQPPSFVAQGESSLVCKLRRSLYELKQSPRAWFGKFSQVVQNFKMTRSETDHSVFYCHSSSGFYISIGRNVVSSKSKKKNIVARSTAEAEYRAMASATCELIWVKQLIQELKFADVQPMKLYCDNQVALHIASNPDLQAFRGIVSSYLGGSLMDTYGVGSAFGVTTLLPLLALAVIVIVKEQPRKINFSSCNKLKAKLQLKGECWRYYKYLIRYDRV
ncbi:hypothetical protein CR513_21514, partial [Mucuna pruriens]